MPALVYSLLAVLDVDALARGCAYLLTAEVVPALERTAAVLLLFRSLNELDARTYVAVEHLVDIDLHPVPTHNATGAETYPTAVSVCVIPVGEGNSGGS